MPSLPFVPTPAGLWAFLLTFSTVFRLYIDLFDYFLIEIKAAQTVAMSGDRSWGWGSHMALKTLVYTENSIEGERLGRLLLPAGVAHLHLAPSLQSPHPTFPNTHPSKSEPGSSLFCCLLTADSSALPRHPSLPAGARLGCPPKRGQGAAHPLSGKLQV